MGLPLAMAWSARVWSCLFILQACRRAHFAKFVHFDHEIDRSTTDFAVFDVFLGLDGTIDQQDETLPTVGALDPRFDHLVDHQSGPMRKMRPLSVEKYIQPSGP